MTDETSISGHTANYMLGLLAIGIELAPDPEDEAQGFGEPPPGSQDDLARQTWAEVFWPEWQLVTDHGRKVFTADCGLIEDGQLAWALADAERRMS